MMDSATVVSGVRIGERPDMWRRLALAAAVPAMAAFLVAFYLFGYQAFTGFRPIDRLEFATIDSPGSTYQTFVSPCSDGDPLFLFSVWVKEKAAAGP